MIGSTLSHYSLTAKLGEGGMGEVYRAQDSKLGRDVAIKVLPEAVATDPERLARFEREARVLAALDHPNIAAIYGLEEADGRQLLVMQLAEGETIAQRLERGAIPVADALPMAQQIIEALEAAHDKGIVHRDLKPANVVVDPQGQIKVLDFGLAKALDPQTISGGQENSPLSLSPTLTAQMTSAGVLLGTAAYMSPEQARGQEADRGSDMWGFGVVLYEMLTGERLFHGSTVSDTLAAVLRAAPDFEKLPKETPASVRRLLRRCLERESRYRLSDASTAWLDLQDARDPKEEVATVAAAAVDAAPAWKRALPWAVAGAALAALVVGLVLPSGSQPVATAPASPMRLEVAVSEHKPDVNLGANYVLSPDGSHLVYVVIDNEQNSLMYVRSLDRLESTLLASGSGAETPYHPFFSPDGSWIGFVTPTELKKIPITGGAPIVLAEMNRSRGASWAPDDSIVFTPDPESPLMRMSSSGGKPEAITVVDEDEETGHRWPQVLPSGRHVLFTSSAKDAQNFNSASLEVLDLASGERKVVHEGGTYGRYAAGGFLLFLNEGTLFARAFDLDRLEATGPPVPVVQGVTQDLTDGGAQFELAPTGTLVYFSGEDQLEEYPILQSDRQGDVDVLWDELGAYGGHRYSPGGDKLVLARFKDENADIWVHDLDRGSATRLTFESGPDFLPVWSPDGEYVVFASVRDGSPGLFRKRADGSGEAESLVETDKGLNPSSWSNDGRFIAGVTLGQSFDLFVLDLEGEGEIETYLSTPFIEWYPSFSPDGRWIAYMSDESGRYEVYVRPYPQAGGRWQISVDGGGQPRWSADGSQLYYRTETGLMVADVEASGDSLSARKPRVLFDGPFRGGVTGLSSSNIQPDWDISADGERFVFFEQSKQQGRGTVITMVFNFDQELARLVSK